MKQRINIKIYFKLGKIATETYKILKQVYRENGLSNSLTFEWFSHFQNGGECVEDDMHTGWPHSMSMSETFEKLCGLLYSDRELTIHVLINELNISKKEN